MNKVNRNKLLFLGFAAILLLSGCYPNSFGERSSSLSYGEASAIPYSQLYNGPYGFAGPPVRQAGPRYYGYPYYRYYSYPYRSHYYPYPYYFRGHRHHHFHGVRISPSPRRSFHSRGSTHSHSRSHVPSTNGRRFR